MEAEGEEASPQQVAQSGQVGDGEVVRVHASAPHPVNHPVRHVEKNHHLNEAEAACLHLKITASPSLSIFPKIPATYFRTPGFLREYLQQCSSQVEANEDGCQGGVATPQGADGVEEDEVSWRNQQEKDTG